MLRVHLATLTFKDFPQLMFEESPRLTFENFSEVMFERLVSSIARRTCLNVKIRGDQTKLLSQGLQSVSLREYLYN